MKKIAAALLGFALLAAPAAAPASATRLSMEVRPENRTILIPGPGDGTVQIQVIAPDDAVPRDRPNVNLALVIDRSGSMSAARKLDFVKTAAHRLVDMMGREDVLSIVTYDDRVSVPWPARRVDGNREELHRIIEGLYPGGSTFLSGGLEEGFRQALRGRRGGYLNRVLLLSDGLANVGVTGRGALREISSGMARRGVSVSTFGVGNDFDEELMAGISAAGDGNYRYLGDPEGIVAALSDELRIASRTIASEVEIVIRLRSGCRFGSALGREWRQAGDAYVIRLGDLPAGERRTVFASLNVTGDRTGVLEVGEVALRYRDPATEKTVTAAPKAFSLELVRDERIYREGFDRSVQEKKAVAQSSVLVQEAARLADEGKKDQAKETLGKAAAGLAAAPPSPAVKAEMERAAEYGSRLDAMTDMSTEEAKGIQKEIKYRSHRQLRER
ncbi:MAG: VWA domain-containing protein [Thermodesulfobacteriota bacterium]